MRISGTTFYYSYVCLRKMWYFVHEINMESNSEAVSIGKSIHDQYYQREKKEFAIDDTIVIDYISNDGVIHEVKKSNKIEEATIAQLKYYLYYLQQKGTTHYRGQINYPLLKKTIDVELTSADVIEIEEQCKLINSIASEKTPPKINKKSICKSCAYYDLCFI